MDIRQHFFPMKLPSGVSGRSVESEDAQEHIKRVNHRIFPPGFKQEIGLYNVPDERQGNLKNLKGQHIHSSPEWIIFSDDYGEEVGWFFGYMEDEETFFIDTIGFVPEFRGAGIYSAFLKQLIDYLKAMGYERLTTSHHPNNRAALIADLKTGFIIAGMELHESHGPMVKMA